MTLHLPRALRRAAIGAALALATAAPLAAAPLSYLSLEELARRSDACVLARVTDARTHWNDSRTLIVTTFTLEVEDALAGLALPGPSSLHRVGGELDGLALGYDSMPELAVGERAVVFVLERAPGQYVVSGLRQGVLHEQEGRFRRELRDVIGAPAPVESLDLPQLTERLRRAEGARP